MDTDSHSAILDDLVRQEPRLFAGRTLVPVGDASIRDALWLAVRRFKVTAVADHIRTFEKVRLLAADSKLDLTINDWENLPAEFRGSFDLVWIVAHVNGLNLDKWTKQSQGVFTALKKGGILAGIFSMQSGAPKEGDTESSDASLDKLLTFWNEAGFEIEEHWPVSGDLAAGQTPLRYMKFRRQRKQPKAGAKKIPIEWLVLMTFFIAFSIAFSFTPHTPHHESQSIGTTLMYLSWILVLPVFSIKKR